MDGKQMARCRACRRRLTSTEAISAGFGPVCYRRLFGRSLSYSVKGSEKGQSKSKKSRVSARMRIPVNQISVFDTQEVQHGTDAQSAG